LYSWIQQVLKSEPGGKLKDDMLRGLYEDFDLF